MKQLTSLVRSRYLRCHMHGQVQKWQKCQKISWMIQMMAFNYKFYCKNDFWETLQRELLAHLYC